MISSTQNAMHSFFGILERKKLAFEEIRCHCQPSVIKIAYLDSKKTEYLCEIRGGQACPIKIYDKWASCVRSRENRNNQCPRRYRATGNSIDVSPFRRNFGNYP